MGVALVQEGSQKKLEPMQGLIEDFEVGGGGGRHDCEQGDVHLCAKNMRTIAT